MIIDAVKFKHQSVRDLAWALSAPPLMVRTLSQCYWPDRHWYQQLYAEAEDWLLRLDKDSTELDELLTIQKDRRLGKYFETLWYYWLCHSHRYQIIEKNLQINIDGETLGEIDFILYDKIDRHIVHWELAVKFYLGAGDAARMHNWYGIRIQDRLDIKLAHLLNKQSTISSNQQVRYFLRQRGIRIDRCAVILKGRLYYPWQAAIDPAFRQQMAESMAPSQHVSDSLYGGWLRLHELEGIFEKNQAFVPLIKTGWLAEPELSENTRTCSGAEIRAALEADSDLHLPLHLLVCNPAENRPHRLFLVDENWPGP